VRAEVVAEIRTGAIADPTNADFAEHNLTGLPAGSSTLDRGSPFSLALHASTGTYPSRPSLVQEQGAGCTDRN
jgi:hypothetical protein